MFLPINFPMFVMKHAFQSNFRNVKPHKYLPRELKVKDVLVLGGCISEKKKTKIMRTCHKIEQAGDWNRRLFILLEQFVKQLINNGLK